MKGCDLEAARRAKVKAGSVTAGHSEVVGIGITRCGEGFAVKINLRGVTAKPADLPGELDGVPVLYEIVGTIRARPSD